MEKQALCYLDSYKEDDIDAFSALLEDQDVMMYMGGPFDIESIEEAFEENLEDDVMLWAVRHHQDHVYMGHVALDATEVFGVREILILLAPNFWGYGHGTQLLKILIQKGRETKDIEELQLLVDPRNLALQKVCEKAGLENAETLIDDEGEMMLFRVDVNIDADRV